MELWLYLVAVLLSFAQAQFFSPSFALSALPIPLGFPQGFMPQSLNLPVLGPTPKPSKKSNPGTFSSFPLPPDPAANPAITALLTSARDVKIEGKKEKGIKALFDQGSFRSFNLEMSPQNFAIISADPTKELRVHCRLTTDYNTPQAKTFADFAVGCGYKGSVGSLRVCLDENRRDNKICRKLSWRVDARAFENKSGNKTKAKDAPLIYGMRTLFFAGMPVDLSLVSERTAYSLMNSFGMIASMSTHAKLFLNGKYLGLYSFIQPIDEEFTQINFAKDKRKGKGALYKELWLNPLHMKDISSYYQSGAKSDEQFMREVMAAIERTPLSGDAPRQFFDQYFDVQSLVDLTAFNTVIGATDDWRQRHNFYLYVREDNFGKKIVWIPWDYDRLHDEGAETRGALKGLPWWDIAATATPTACNQPIKSPQEQANSMGGTPAKIAWNKDIFEQFPLDIYIPVTCDKLTKLMAQALAPRIRQRTKEMAGQLSIARIRAMWDMWNAQIQTALERDPSGPPIAIMKAQQAQLEQHLTRAMQKAVSEANRADGISSPLPLQASLPVTTRSFTPSLSSPALPSPIAPKPALPTFSTGLTSPAISSPALISAPAAPKALPFSSPFASSTTFASSSSFAAPTFPSTSFQSFTPFVPKTSTIVG